jgi:hypothetical protein
VDIVREPDGQQSRRTFPNDSPYARILWERPQPKLKTVETAVAGIANNSGQALVSSVSPQ